MQAEHMAKREEYKVTRIVKRFRIVWLSFNNPMMCKITHKTGYLRTIAPYYDRD